MVIQNIIVLVRVRVLFISETDKKQHSILGWIFTLAVFRKQTREVDAVSDNCQG